MIYSFFLTCVCVCTRVVVVVISLFLPFFSVFFFLDLFLGGKDVERFLFNVRSFPPELRD